MISLPAFAKINLDLRILGVRADGYHDLRTVFQTLELHDTITIERQPGALTIECDDPDVPTDRRNLVWKAASLLCRLASGRSSVPRDLNIRIEKRIPAEAGLGGGSSDAAAALLALVRLWKLDVDLPTLSRLAARLGADVPFFLAGGTALGLGRGDDIYPLADLPRIHVVIVRPGFGVSTVEAYRWYDQEKSPRRREPGPRPVPAAWPTWTATLRNDLEPPVARHHPTIARLRHALIDAGAVVAAMSGSGSAVFGLFERAEAARRTAADLTRPGWRVACTRTLSRADHHARHKRALAGSAGRRIS
jgi:4-diphosphocytidyl-2-C-methyl-D-erythritol kinase